MLGIEKDMEYYYKYLLLLLRICEGRWHVTPLLLVWSFNTLYSLHENMKLSMEFIGNF